MARVHPVILRGGHEEGHGVRLRGIEVLVGRDRLEEGALLGHVRRAIFADPGRARQQQVVAQHVEQRHLHHDRVPQVRPLVQHHAHQEAAIRAALDSEMFRRGDLLRDQVFADRNEVIIDALAVQLQARLVPVGAELAAAADVGEHIGPALLQPEAAHHGAVARRHRNLETAIAVKQGRRLAVQLDVLAVNNEVRHLRAIL